jgi:hypothetical protein
MSEEIVKMHQSVSSFKPTIWLSADRWKMNTWYDMSGNANNMSEHNAITKRKNALLVAGVRRRIQLHWIR